MKFLSSIYLSLYQILLVVAMLAASWAQETTGAGKELEGRNYYGEYGYYGPHYGPYGYGHHGHYGHHYGGYYRPYSSYSYSHFNLGYRDGEQPVEGSVQPIEAAAS